MEIQVELPYLSTAQMIEVDRAMIEDFGIELIQMMENAGRNLAQLARQRFLGGNPVGKKVVVLAGPGGNGGGALVAARRLHNWGADVHVFLAQDPENFTTIPAHQLRILTRMRLSIHRAQEMDVASSAAVILDGLIGYSLKGAPTGASADLIRWANASSTPVLALDVPSGIDASTGTIFDPAIRAVATLTLALPKEGLRRPEVAGNIGELYLADISVPPELYAEPALGLSIGALFAESEILRLR